MTFCYITFFQILEMIWISLEPYLFFLSDFTKSTMTRASPFTADQETWIILQDGQLLNVTKVQRKFSRVVSRPPAPPCPMAPTHPPPPMPRPTSSPHTGGPGGHHGARWHQVEGRGGGGFYGHWAWSGFWISTWLWWHSAAGHHGFCKLWNKVFIATNKFIQILRKEMWL